MRAATHASPVINSLRPIRLPASCCTYLITAGRVWRADLNGPGGRAWVTWRHRRALCFVFFPLPKKKPLPWDPAGLGMGAQGKTAVARRRLAARTAAENGLVRYARHPDCSAAARLASLSLPVM